MDITVAVEEDIPALCELLEVLFTQEAEFQPDREAQVRGVSQILGSPRTGAILVARQGGRVVAMVNLLYTVSTALGARVALLEDMVVSPDARGRGVGSQLLDHAIGYAASHGCKRITLLTDATNEAAQRFYGRRGFAHSEMIPMRLTLE